MYNNNYNNSTHLALHNKYITQGESNCAVTVIRNEIIFY